MMTSQKYVFLTGPLTLFSMASCNFPSDTMSDTTQDNPRTSYTEEAEGRYIANEAAKKIRAYNFVEVEFKPQSSELSEQAKKQINETFQKAIWDGYINNVSVLSWSDAEYPSKNLKALSKDDRKLAEKRNSAIKNYLISLKSVDVDTYNMAEQFIGSYRLDVFSSSNNKNFLNIISDSKNKSSLFLHLPIENTRRKQQQDPSLGNTYQFYIWKSPKK